MLASPPSESTDDLDARHILIGAGVLGLVADWDAWVSRRVDRFCFVGDDERVLERRQSMDFMFPSQAHDLATLTGNTGGIPIPVTFVNKWRLPEFSVSDAQGPLSLLARPESTRIAAGMLLALANLAMRGSPATDPDRPVPREVRSLLMEIVNCEPPRALGLCAGLAEQTGQPEDVVEWLSTLAADPVFMGLAYELARGFVLLALYPDGSTGRRVLSFSYSSYVVPARRDSPCVWAGHLARRVLQRSRDVTDSIAWCPRDDPGRNSSGRITFSTVCAMRTATGRGGEESAACALARVIGPEGRRMTLRLRANSAVALEHAPVGTYSITLEPLSGFQISSAVRQDVVLAGGGSGRVELHANRSDIAAPVTGAPSLLARPGSLTRNLRRGLAWFSKPLAIRVRVGDGGSYHCEFQAPDGMHVTRARLISNAESTDGHERTRELDLVLASRQRAHLYAPAAQSAPAAAYALFNLRPRAETIARPAVWTAAFALVALAFLSVAWHSDHGYTGRAASDSSGLLILLLGAPSALAAYFAQAVPSRVANSMLYGLRVAALFPGILTLAAGAVILIGGGGWDFHIALWGIVLLSVATLAILSATLWCAEHPPEQRSRDLDQGEDYERAYSTGNQAGASKSRADDLRDDRTDGLAGKGASTIRDVMLERAGGLSRATRRMLLTQRGRRGREFKVPPALYFDSAETTPSFSGLHVGQLRSVCSQVHDLMRNADERLEALDQALRSERPVAPVALDPPPESNSQ